MCYKIEVQNKNAEKLNKKLDELNAPQFLRDYLNELESKNGALNYLVAIKDFLQWLIENNIINKKLISEIEIAQQKCGTHRIKMFLNLLNKTNGN